MYSNSMSETFIWKRHSKLFSELWIFIFLDQSVSKFIRFFFKKKRVFDSSEKPRSRTETLKQTKAQTKFMHVWNAETKLPYYITVTSDRELFRTLFTNKL